jgi:putative transposase
VKGRKRFLLVDTLGLVWSVRVVSGDTSEAAGAKQLLAPVKDHLPRWRVVWVDGGYENRIEAWVREHCSFRIEVIKRTQKKGWELLPKRWVVERTFGWLNRWRGLAKEYDFDPGSTEAAIYLAMSHLMLRRLTA